MSLENPYRAAGAFSGKAYIRRDADLQLIEQIEDNQYYPYFAAPRQSGKSSLLLRTMAALDPKKYRCALVDLSPFVVTSYDDFWRQFLHEVARSANFDPTPIGQEDPRDVLLLWLRSCRQRLIVFMDEIDVLLGVDFREQIFSKFRTFFNLRARLDTADLQRLQFVLAGAAHSSRFIKDPRWSPFNVAIEIELEDLSAAQVSQMAAYLGTAGSFAGPDLTARVYELTGGSVFLCQLIFEQLWNQAARGRSRLGAADVDSVVASIVAESPRNIHFYNIFRLVTADARLTMLFRRLTDGQELGHEEAKELRLTGICRGANPFRNDIYARVFGPGGPLDLKVGDKQIQLTRALDSAISRRDSLQNDPRADPRSISVAEAEIKRLRKEFREGAQLQAGDVLGRGRYLLEERIGQGGFAAVWRAIDTRDRSLVAIKVLHGQFAEDKSRRERFFRGAWKMSELQHPAIVRVLEPYGDENGQYYFVMEHLPGGTLHAAIQEMDLSADRALTMLMQVGEALNFAHERGLVHRDVKPSNVLIDGERGKLTDFDLVRETDITGGTRTGAMGTFLYAAPEVMSRPQDADPRADIYGLGMTAVFALFGGDLAMDVIRDADRFIDRLPCNPVIHDVLKKAVAWDRNDRFATALEFVTALGHARAAEAGPVRSKRAVASEKAAIAAGATAPAPAARPLAGPAAPEPTRGLQRPAPPASAPAPSVKAPVRPAEPVAPAPPMRAPEPVLASASGVAVGGRSRMLDEDGFAASGEAPVEEHVAIAAMSADASRSSGARPVVGRAVPADARPPAANRSSGHRRDEAKSAASPALAEASPPVGASAGPTTPPGRAPDADRDGPVSASKTTLTAGRVLAPEPEAAASAEISAIRSTAIYGAAAPTSGDDGDDAPWDREILVPERTGTSMLRAAVMRGAAGGRERVRDDSPPRAASGAPASAQAVPSDRSDPVVADDRTSTREVAPGMQLTGTQPQARAGWALPVALIAVAAALLLAFFLPDLLERDPTVADAASRRHITKRDEPERGPYPDPSVPPVIPTIVPPTTVDPRTAETRPSADDGTTTSGEADSDGQASGPVVGDSQASHGATASGVAASGGPETTHTGDTKHDRPPTTPQAKPVSEQIQLGCEEVRNGDAERGVAILRKAHDRKPGDMKLQRCIADGYAKLNEWEAAASYYERLLAEYPRQPAALLGAAQANEALNRRVAARAFYGQLLALDPKNRSARAFFADDEKRSRPDEPAP